MPDYEIIQNASDEEAASPYHLHQLPQIDLEAPANMSMISGLIPSRIKWKIARTMRENQDCARDDGLYLRRLFKNRL
jgi:hypothetical protein